MCNDPDRLCCYLLHTIPLLWEERGLVEDSSLTGHKINQHVVVIGLRMNIEFCNLVCVHLLGYNPFVFPSVVVFVNFVGMGWDKKEVNYVGVGFCYLCTSHKYLPSERT